MTDERRRELEEKLNMAEAKGDPAEIAAVKKTMEQEYRLCTSHTADRLKRVEAMVKEIKDGLIPAQMFSEIQSSLAQVTKSVSMLQREIESWKSRAHGAKMLWRILRYVIAAGGGGLLIKLLSAYNPS